LDNDTAASFGEEIITPHAKMTREKKSQVEENLRFLIYQLVPEAGLEPARFEGA